MAGFFEPLRIEEIPDDNRRWILLDECVYHLKTPDGVEIVKASIGFITDFGSIPQFLWWVSGLSPFGKLRRAYVIHDWLYRNPVVEVGDRARAITREEADLILLEACDVLGANWLNRRIIYRGVRVGGESAWNKHRQLDSSGVL